MLRINNLVDPTPEELEEHFKTYSEKSASCTLSFTNNDCIMPEKSIAAFSHLPERVSNLSLTIGRHYGKPYPSSEIAKGYLLSALRAAALTKVTKLSCMDYLFHTLSQEDVKEVFQHIPSNIQEISFNLSPFETFNTKQLSELSATLSHDVKFTPTAWAFTAGSQAIETLNYYRAEHIKKWHDKLQGDVDEETNLEYSKLSPAECEKIFQQMPLQKMLIDMDFHRLLKQLFDKKGNYASVFENDPISGDYDRAIEKICTALIKEKELLLTSDETIENKKTIFKNNCTQIINKACEGVLGQHRGYKKVLDELFKLICAIFSPDPNGYFYMFFRPQTDTEKLACKLSNAIQEHSL